MGIWSLFDSSSGEAGRLDELNQGIAEFDTEVVQVRQRLRDLNWRAISSLEE